MPNKILSNITSVYTDKSINGWVRGIIWIGTIAVVYVAGKAIYTKVFPSQSALDQQKRADQINADIKAAQNNGQTLSFPQTTYNNDADSIAAQFTGCDPTVSLGGVILTASGHMLYNLLNGYKNNLDVLTLQQAFGVRTITKSILCGGDYTNVDLSSAITYQLNTAEIQAINDMLKAKGITVKIA